MIALVETAIAGRSEVDVTLASVTLTRLNGAPDTSRAAILVVTGTPGVLREVIVPALQKMYLVSNESDAIVTVRTLLGVGINVAVGTRVLLYTDAVLNQVIDVNLSGSGGGTVAISGAGIAVASAWVDGAAVNTIFNVQGNIVSVNFAPGSIAAAIDNTQMILEPQVGTFPFPPTQVMEYFDFINEGGTIHPAYAVVAIDGSNIEWFKSDGTPWIFGSIRTRISVQNTFLYSMAAT